MQVFLVGGAIRDRLMGYPYNERDWVVVGATPEELLKNGFRQVGSDFPVFLHPKTQEEYALARTERKSGKGYHGFICDFSADISLEEDLARRDLTINAIAEDENGNIIDPYNGQGDLKEKLLRHVTPAFAEDPLRVLRVARFAARYYHLGFSIADETKDLMLQLAVSGELKTLTPERIWQEIQKALSEKSPQVFFEVLHECKALQSFLPELDVLWGIPNPAQWHPEIDSGIHTMMVLEQAAILSDSVKIRFAALCHDLGKGRTDASLWPSHPGHEKSGVAIIESICKRLKIPNDCKRLAQLTSEYHLHCHRAFELKASTLVDFIDRCGAYKKPNDFLDFLVACEADFRGRTGFEERPYPQRELLIEIAEATKHIDSQPFLEQGLNGAAIGDAIRAQRITITKTFLKRTDK